jgi:hypothetical protein
MIFRLGLAMNNHDLYVHALGISLLISSGFLALRIEEQPLKTRVSLFFKLVLSLLLADAITHLLPNAVADFIYSTRHHYPSNCLLPGK